jgi:hypothetical protein
MPVTISIRDRAVTPAQKTLAAEPTGLLPFNLWVDDSDSPADIIDALALPRDRCVLHVVLTT